MDAKINFQKWIITAGILVLMSPWFLVIIQNRSLIFANKVRFIAPRDQIFIDNINELRGETSSKNLGLIGRLIVNKYTFFAGQEVTRYLKTYDPHYLFFESGPDLTKNPWASGPIYLAYLPFFLYGIYILTSFKKIKLKFIVFSLLLVSPLPSLLIFSYYESLARVPFFIVFTFITALGMLLMIEKKKILAKILIILLLFEFIRFFHNFKVHYPGKLSEQIYNIRK